MTPPGTPDDEAENGRTEPEGPDRDERLPPPPQWGDAQLPPGAHLLPEPEPLPEFGTPLPEPEEEDLSDRTVSDIDISGTMRTQIFTQEGGQAGGQAPPPQAFTEPPSPSDQAPPFPGAPAPDTTVTDLSGVMPAAGDKAAEDGTRRTREEPTPEPPRTEQIPTQQQAHQQPQPPPGPQPPPAPPLAAPTPPAPQPPAPQAPAPQPPAPQAPAPQPLPPFPYAQEPTTQQIPDAQAAAAGAGDEPDAEMTQIDPGGRDDDEEEQTQIVKPGPAAPPQAQTPSPQPQSPSPQPPAPEPFPWAQEVPEAPEPRPSAPEPFPWAQEIPDARQPPAPAPPAPAPPAPSAPEPFPWAQEIPSTPQAPAPSAPSAPSAPEPFPWAQEIPDTPKPQPSGPEPFPYAQEIPGAQRQAGPSPQPPAETPHPVAPPPQINEPWRTDSAPKKRTGRRINKKVLLGTVGGIAAAAIIAAGAFVALSGGGDDEGGSDGARLAGGLFPVDPAARSDGRDQELTDVAAVGTTVVAAGGEADPGNYRGLLLYSTDGGRTFKSADVRGADGGLPANGEVPRQVAGGAHGWVAIGSRPGGGAVWTSQDGRSWQRLPDAAGDTFGPGNKVNRVIGTESGFLAIGENSRKGDFSDSVPAAWLSNDGQRWEALTGEQVGIPVRGKVSLIEAAATGSTVVMESLHAPDAKKAPFRRVWKSSDAGRTWSPAKLPAPKGTRSLAVGGGKPGLLAVREIKSGSKSYAQTFTSSDGAAWKQGGRIETPGYREVHRLLATDGGYVAIVKRGNDYLVSRSADGASWQEAGTLPTNSGRALQGAAAAGEQTVLVGRDTGGGDLNSLLAVRDARGAEIPVDPAKIAGAVRPDHAVSGLAAKEGRAVAVGSSGGDAAVWSSQNGSSWTRAQFPGGLVRPASQRLTGAVSGGAGWLAVGDGGGAPRRPLVVTSADGASWQAADNNPAFAQNGPLSLATYGAAAGPAGYVIVGEDGLSGATWFSPDLKTWQRGRGLGKNDLTALPNGNRWLRAAAGGAFGFVGVGGLQDPKAGDAPGQRPAVWTSTDGKQWKLSQLPLPAGLGEGSLTQVAAKGNVLVAAGSATGAAGAVPLAFVSSDGGRTWRESKIPAPAKEVRVTALTATPGGFAATGTASAQGTTDVVAWTSPDGSSWQPSMPGGKGLAGQGDQQITGLAPFGGKLLGVGRTADQEEQPVLWTRPLP